MPEKKKKRKKKAFFQLYAQYFLLGMVCIGTINALTY